ncbi:MAG: hypothetical protein IKB96_12080 [Prevotella sp.]|nr:hypothetical protein [Prevotella sp.]
MKPAAQAREIEPDWTWRVAPSDRTNTGALLRMKMDSIEQRVAEIIEQYEAEQAALEAEQAASYEYYEPTYYAPTYSGVSGDPDGLNSFVGIIDGVNGTRETAYSSSVLYHYRTSEWTPDEYGFYRTDEGYYVVASSDYEQGTVIETTRGEAMVLDSGCDSGIVDFYTDWP